MAKNALKSNLLTFYVITYTQNYQFFTFFAFSHAHTRTYIRIKTQTKHTMVITTYLQKDFFEIFSFAKFEYLHHTIVSKLPSPGGSVSCVKRTAADYKRILPFVLLLERSSKKQNINNLLVRARICAPG